MSGGGQWVSASQFVLDTAECKRCGVYFVPPEGSDGGYCSQVCAAPIALPPSSLAEARDESAMPMQSINNVAEANELRAGESEMDYLGCFDEPA